MFVVVFSSLCKKKKKKSKSKLPLIENPQQFEEKAQRKVRKSSKMSKPLLRTESIHSNSITAMSIVTTTNKIKEPDDKQQITKW